MDFTQWTTYLWFIPVLIVIIMILCTIHTNNAFERAVVFRLGKLRAIRGAGLFMTAPFVDSIFEKVDTRVFTDVIEVEQAMTKDTVPVKVEAVIFWHVLDTPDAIKKAVLTVEDYGKAIDLAGQTALRDVIGQTALGDLLSNRDMVDKAIADKIAINADSWGIEVSGVEIRDVALPDSLTDAMSRQAQAERERQARNILAQSEIEVAAKFAQAAEQYSKTPTSLHLRAMNMLGEALKDGKATMLLVPSSALDTMNLGSTAVATAMKQAGA